MNLNTLFIDNAVSTSKFWIVFKINVFGNEERRHEFKYKLLRNKNILSNKKNGIVNIKKSSKTALTYTPKL